MSFRSSSCPTAKALREHVDELRLLKAQKERKAAGALGSTENGIVSLPSLVEAVKAFQARAEELDRTTEAVTGARRTKTGRLGGAQRRAHAARACVSTRQGAARKTVVQARDLCPRAHHRLCELAAAGNSPGPGGTEQGQTCRGRRFDRRPDQERTSRSMPRSPRPRRCSTVSEPYHGG